MQIWATFDSIFGGTENGWFIPVQIAHWLPTDKHLYWNEKYAKNAKKYIIA